MTRKENKSHFYLTIILVLLAFFFTRVHELIHWIYAYLLGWEALSTSGLLAGSTDIAMQNPPSLLSIWIFYLIPPIAIYIIIMYLTIYHPNRFIRAMGVVITGLNIASFSPELPTSDSYNAMQELILHGINSFYAISFHWIIYILALGVYVIYIYIITDNDNKDVGNRINTIFK